MITESRGFGLSQFFTGRGWLAEHGLVKSGTCFVLGWLLLSVLPAAHAAEMEWRPMPGGGEARVEGGRLLLKLSGEAEATGLRSAQVPVTPNTRMHLAFAYTSENLGIGVFDHNSARRRRTVRLVASLRWLDDQGADVDAKRAGLGFPPLAIRWQFHADSTAPRRVADNVSVPGEARAVEISFRLETAAEAGDKDRVTVVKAAIGDVALRMGQITPQGLETADSGPADAGPLSTPPESAFVANLVPNPTFNEGTEAPIGWRIEGDNSHASAVWQEGGAFSGRRCLKLYDRGPYVRSWGEHDSSVYVPGGSPGGNVASAREEVSARWVSEPSLAQAGAVYQAKSFLWYANRHRISAGGASPMNANPVRIQFLDAAGKVLPYEPQRQSVWQDWLPNELPFAQEGWVRALSKPVVAPANAVSVRVAVVMHHAFYDTSWGRFTKHPSNRGFVLVDNISLYRVLSEREQRTGHGQTPFDPEEAFWDTAQAGGLPFVPTSAAHRPDTLSVESETGYAGGILFAPANPRSKPLNLRLRNWISDPRKLDIRCEVEDWLGRTILKNTLSVTLPPYGSGTASLAYPDELPLGAYTIHYVIHEAGIDQDQGFTRFAVLAKRETTPEERGRDDYPFSIWTPFFRGDAPMGQMLDAAGMGKSWYAGRIDIQPLIQIEDPPARRRAVEEQIAKARVAIEGHRRYGITPMGMLHARMSEEERPKLTPVLEEVVGQVVTALKNEIRHWRWGNEFVHGKATELDRGTNADGGPYLYWGHPGTVRQYWETYRVAYHAAKAADPNCLFGPAVAHDESGTVLRLFFQVCGPDELDSFGMNTYVWAHALWRPNLAELEKAGIPDLPLYASEFNGLGTHTEAVNTGPTRLEEERDNVRLQATYWPMVLTSYPNFFHLAQTWLWWNGNDKQNMLHKNRVRPYFVAHAAMTDLLGAGRFVERLDLPGAVIHLRERSVRPGLVGVMWSTGPEAVVKLEVGSESVEVADVMGNRRPLATPGGVATLALTPMPQYLLGASVVRPAP